VKVPLAYVALPLVPVEPISACDHPEGSADTVKVELFAACPPTVTENVPEDAPACTTVIIVLSLQDITLTLAEFNEIVLAPWVEPKPLPTIVTDEPTGPLPGEIPVMAGVA
jgi:hypothetical protein